MTSTAGAGDLGETVKTADGALQVDRWSTDRAEVVRWFDDRLSGDGAVEGGELLEQVVAAGVLALRTANATVDADYVAREFDQLLGSVEQTMTEHHERVADHFDPNRTDSFVSRLRDVMSEFVDGGSSKMARLLDLTDEQSPLRAIADEIHEVRDQVEGYRRELEARDAADTARADERELGTAKGRDFEDVVVDALVPIATASGDSVETVGDVAGAAGNSKCGDVLVTLNPRDTRGVPVLIGIEVKNRSLTAKATRDQLDQTKRNRDATAAVAVFAGADQMPKGTYPFADLGENRFACALDKHDPSDVLAVTLAYRVARHWALADASAGGDEVDLRAMHDAVANARDQLQSFSVLKRKLSTLEKGFTDGVDGIRKELERARQALTTALDRLDDALLVSGDGEASSAA